MNDEIYETPSTTPNFQTELADQLADLMPEAIADGKIDVEKLKELLGGDVADTSERFGLFWPGKKRALRAAQEPTTATLRPDFENSKDWGTTKNVFIEGDNLEVLKVLQKHYHAKVKMIYIDPPYNTGKDFVYPDNYVEGVDTYLEWSRQVNEDGGRLSTNAETEGRFHSNWLNMMYPRLKLARNLLTDDGVIAISIDESEQPHLRKLCDEIFGENNLVAQVTTIVKTEGRRYGFFAKSHEYFLVYSRSEAALQLNEISIEGKTFKFEDELGGFNLRELRNQNTKAFNSRNRPNLRYPFFVDTYSIDKNGLMAVSADPKYATQVEAITVEGLESVWRWGKDKAREMEGELVARNGSDGVTRIFQKVRRITEAPKTVWLGKEFISNKGTQEVDSLFGKKVFDFPKPLALIREILAIGTDRDSIVLDFFTGSATTAHAVMQLNAEDGGSRRHIQVQLPEPTPKSSVAYEAGYRTIADVSRARIELAGDKVVAEAAERLDQGLAPLDIGFRAYRLVDTNFSKWKQSSGVELNKLEQHLLDLRESSSADEASADDLLTEILLKQGYSLTEDISSIDIAGLNLRSVADGVVLAYLNEDVKPTLDQLRAVAEADPIRLVVLEDAFKGDDELKTNVAQLCKSKGIEFWTA
ncbi:site-specific DNA-methyltransferase [Leucobacter sp. NPDC077196]|uniref:site-specific DNA-methyltransferase n=1 Tax=Leucobacter sp. NPDC077196 TaxID=3154959 RepID=UPI00343B8FF4